MVSNNKRIRREQDRKKEKKDKIKKINEENKDLKMQVKSLINIIDHTKDPNRKKKNREKEEKQDTKIVCPNCGSDKLDNITVNRIDGHMMSITMCNCGFRKAEKILKTN